MNPEWIAATRNAISEVMETMFFTLVEFKNGAPPVPWQIGSYIELMGDGCSIGLTFHITEKFSRILTANFLGVDETHVRREEMEDAANELANMVGGSLMPKISGANWQLSLPSLLSPARLTSSKDAQVGLSYWDEPVGTVLIECN